MDIPAAKNQTADGFSDKGSTYGTRRHYLLSTSNAKAISIKSLRGTT
jgi:hypothetical protein